MVAFPRIKYTTHSKSWMKTIAELQTKLRKFDARAQSADSSVIANTWRDLFGMSMDKQSANAFASYYKEMRSRSIKRRDGCSRGNVTYKKRRSSTKTRSYKHRGGAAPLDYQMVPGANVSVYGHFPVEADTDPATIRDLDVYWQSGMTCIGSPSGWPAPAADMGSNKVGGGRRKRRTHRMRGGDRPFVASVPPNILQWGYNAAVGGPAPVPSSPVQHTWQYLSNGTSGLINPGNVTPINSDMTRLASPAPWQTA